MNLEKEISPYTVPSVLYFTDNPRYPIHEHKVLILPMNLGKVKNPYTQHCTIQKTLLVHTS